MIIFILLVFFNQNVVSKTETPTPSLTLMQCPYNYYYKNQHNGCYRYYGSALAYDRARENCEHQLNGHLITVDSAEKHQVILDILAAEGKTPTSGMYIGLHTSNTTVYKWYTGPYNYTGYSNWAGDTPGAAETQRMVHLDKDSLEWVSSSTSSQTRKYMCESDPNNKTLGELFPRCPYGYRHTFNNSCYRIYLEKILWDEAVEQCECQGARLTKVDSQEEFDFLRPEVNAKSGKSWVGLNRENNESHWAWLDGTTYGTGVADESDKNLKCAAMSTQHDGGYHAQNCGSTRWFAFCEIPQYEPSKQAVCLEGDSGFSNLFDGDAATCEEPPEKGFNFVEIKNDCLNNCSTEVRIVVTLDNADSCSWIPIYYEDMLDCGKPYWAMCPLVADHLSESSECEILCHCHNSTTENCNLMMKKPAYPVPAGYSICEVNLV